MSFVYKSYLPGEGNAQYKKNWITFTISGTNQVIEGILSEEEDKSGI